LFTLSLLYEWELNQVGQYTTLDFLYTNDLLYIYTVYLVS